MSLLPKSIFIVGPTGSGKTSLSLNLAKEFSGEIISADSRQFYKKMTIGTSKALGNWGEKYGEESYLVEGIPHYMVDLIDPGKQISLAEFKNQAFKHIKAISERGHIPFVVGGTGLYIWGIVDNLDIPPIPPNKKLRLSLEGKPLPELVKLLDNVDPAALPMIDLKNPRRVIRALEIAILSGSSLSEQRSKKPPVIDSLQVGIRRNLADLYSRIDKTVDDQIKRGWVEETLALVRQKYSWELPSMSSIGYRQLADYLNDKHTLEEAVAKIKMAVHHYAKRQLTWFKRDKRIHWIEGDDLKTARSLTKRFLKI